MFRLKEICLVHVKLLLNVDLVHFRATRLWSAGRWRMRVWKCKILSISWKKWENLKS